MGLPDMVDQLSERKVGVISQGHDLVGMRFKTMGTMIAAP